MDSTDEKAPAAGSNAQRERRQRILDATIRLASEGGFEAVQMRTVADQAEVALGTLYRYFPSKIHLLVTALGREFEGAEQLASQLPVPGNTSYDRVMYVLSRATRNLQREPHLTEALTRAFMFADASVKDEIHTVGMTLQRLIARAITGDVDHAEATDHEAAVIRVIADVWLSALVGWVTGRSTAQEVEQSVGVAVRLLLPNT